MVMLLVLVLAVFSAGCTGTGNEEGVSGAVSQLPESSAVSEPSQQSEISSEAPVESSASSSGEAELNAIEDVDSKYFVNRLPKRLKECFEKLYSSAVDFEDEVIFPHSITENDLTTMMYLLNYDCPELIHVSGDYHPMFSTNPDKPIEGVGLFYTMEKDEYVTARGELNDYIEKLMSRVEGQDEYRIEKAVYDEIFRNCTYNENTEYSGSVYGALICGQARCEGICKSLMWCLRRLGIECLCVSGSQTWNSTALYSDHSWNIVRLGGKYYHLDLTLDNMRTSDDMVTNPNYGFFNCNDAFVMGNREINQVFCSLGIPECDSMDLNYHEVNDYVVHVNEDIRGKLESALARNFTSEGIAGVSIRCEDHSDFVTLGSEAAIWVQDFLSQSSTDQFKINTYASDLSQTLLIEAVLK